MKRLKMLTGLGGVGKNYVAGDEDNFPVEEADRLIEAGFAEEVKTQSKPAAKAPAKKAK